LIKAYFNRSVNTSYASSIENEAISLPNAIDDTLIAYINRAQHSIDLMVYNLSEGNSSMSDIVAALNFAYSNGRSVRVIFNEDTGNTGINDLNPNIPRIESPEPVFPQFGIMHNKIFIFDAFSSNANRPIVWTGSTNLTPDQINVDPNNVIIVQDQSLAKAFTMEFEEMWGSNGLTPNPSNARFGPQKRDNTPHIFNIGGKRLECYFSPSDGVNKRIIDAISEATHDVSVNSMLITRNDIRDALILGHINGKHTLILVDDPSSSSTYSNLVASLSWRVMNYDDLNGSGTLHHKLMMADVFGGSNTFVLTGSHNWSTSAEDRNDENTLIIYDENIANQYLQEFMGRLGSIASNPELNGGTLSIFPNPSSGTLELRTAPTNKINRIELIDTKGTILLSRDLIGQNALNLDLSALPSGVFFTRIHAEQNLWVEKIVLR
jgi:phosphatidylserine/phosphatidylglycerophosphate/cardiolipin synthase-like enzyme